MSPALLFLLHNLLWLWACLAECVPQKWQGAGLMPLCMFATGLLYATTVTGVEKGRESYVDAVLCAVNMLSAILIWYIVEYHWCLERALANIGARHDIDVEAVRAVCWARGISATALSMAEQLFEVRSPLLGESLPPTFTAYMQRWVDSDAHAKGGETNQFFARMARAARWK